MVRLHSTSSTIKDAKSTTVERSVATEVQPAFAGRQVRELKLVNKQKKCRRNFYLQPPNLTFAAKLKTTTFLIK
jgi:hypothetical protein